MTLSTFNMRCHWPLMPFTQGPCRPRAQARPAAAPQQVPPPSKQYFFAQPTGTLGLHRNPDGSLHAQIDTARLRLASVAHTDQDLNRIRQVFRDSNVMRYYSRGIPKSEASCQKRWHKWAGLWERGVPYSGLTISNKSTDDFLGFVRLSASSEPGIAELTFLLLQNAWSQGYGTEAARAILGVYVPALRSSGYKIQGAALGCVVATVHPENRGSAAVLRKAGMSFKRPIQKYDECRLVYAYNVNAETENFASIEDALVG